MQTSRQIFIHCCCAPDSTVPLKRLSEEGWEPTCVFYGSNIHPETEYRWRLEEMEKVAALMEVELKILPYDPESWFEKARVLAGQPEGKARCGLCFALQLAAAAECAAREGCAFLCTTLTISPHKCPEKINRIGKAVAQQAGLEWLERTWRKRGGFLESVLESRLLGLRRQTYCGCLYSFKGDEVV